MSQRLKKFRYGGRCGRRDRNEKSAQVEREPESKGKRRVKVSGYLDFSFVLSVGIDRLKEALRVDLKGYVLSSFIAALGF